MITERDLNFDYISPGSNLPRATYSCEIESAPLQERDPNANASTQNDSSSADSTKNQSKPKPQSKVKKDTTGTPLSSLSHIHLDGEEDGGSPSSRLAATFAPDKTVSRQHEESKGGLRSRPRRAMCEITTNSSQPRSIYQEDWPSGR